MRPTKGREIFFFILAFFFVIKKIWKEGIPIYIITIQKKKTKKVFVIRRLPQHPPAHSFNPAQI
jgi:hypothetical protein